MVAPGSLVLMLNRDELGASALTLDSEALFRAVFYDAPIGISLMQYGHLRVVGARP